MLSWNRIIIPKQTTLNIIHIAMKTILLLFLMLVTQFAWGAVRTFNPIPKVGNSQKNKPLRSVTSDDEGISVNYTISQIMVQDDDEVYPGTVFMRIDGFGLTDEPGTPSVPFRRDSYKLPEGCSSVNLTIEKCNYVDVDYELTPARPDLPAYEDVVYSQSNVPAIVSSSITAEETLIKQPVYAIINGDRYAKVEVMPISYDSRNKKVRIYYELNFRLTYKFDQPRNTKNRILDITTDRFNTIYTPEFLIISTPEYKSQCDRYVETKRRMGFNATAIYKSDWTTSAVSDSISTRYHSAKGLDYVLIAGGVDDVPSNNTTYGIDSEYIDTHGKTYPTDQEYVCMDGNKDYDADIFIGRIPVNNADELETVIDKITNYQLNPPLNEDFFRKSLHCSYFQTKNYDKFTEGYRFLTPSELIRDYVIAHNKDVQRIYAATEGSTPTYFINGDKLPEELRDPHYDWSILKNTQIANAINDGRFYTLYIGHGDVTLWGQPQFTTKDISTLSNGNLLPVVFSISCFTGKFDQNDFAQKFLKHKNGGCVGIIAGSYLTYIYSNAYFACGIFNGIWPTPGLNSVATPIEPDNNHNSNLELGQILRAGLSYRESIVQSSDITTKKRYHVFGDPSMMMFTQTPIQFDKDEYDIRFNSGGGVSGLRTVSIKFEPKTEGCYLVISSKEGNYTRRYVGGVNYTGMIESDAEILIYGPNRVPKSIGKFTIGDIIIPLYPSLNVQVANRSCKLSLDQDIESTDVEVKVFDMYSNEVKSESIHNFTKEAVVDLSGLNRGVYAVALLENGVRIGTKTISL